MPDSSDKQERIEQIRRDFAREELLESVVRDDPIKQFAEWFEQALSSDLLDANAMSLSTATEEGIPSSRIVLLKGIDKQGFRFYTNYESRKGRELQENPHAALCFYWAPLERQVRIEGRVEKLSQEESEVYFHQRPRLSQLGAWASKQSAEVASRSELEKQFRAVKERFEDKEIPLPDFWGGFRLKPQRIEFWQGRTGRLHDRICYEKKGDDWNIFRLSP
ncbi:pyridoxamine 5'-phosphate oxidase [Fodinibius salsisoli]|uniref:Pyridoxamine 5'-phosphate oxidase n=1 Tax=Fodinibius salsisoli TaxID=2820877 RepID=A0ABT3PJ59_9BACT|nr:pyridoxamine 5'-phosphate oxidase [Fodinibius salsisoli]MCW9705980.1 pyridoxamine 5'-phosphate oxidase [Fodinibius salsisoli]